MNEETQILDGEITSEKMMNNALRITEVEIV